MTNFWDNYTCNNQSFAVQSLEAKLNKLQPQKIERKKGGKIYLFSSAIAFNYNFSKHWRDVRSDISFCFSELLTSVWYSNCFHRKVIGAILLSLFPINSTSPGRTWKVIFENGPLIDNAVKQQKRQANLILHKLVQLPAILSHKDVNYVVKIRPFLL